MKKKYENIGKYFFFKWNLLLKTKKSEKLKQNKGKKKLYHQIAHAITEIRFMCEHETEELLVLCYPIRSNAIQSIKRSICWNAFCSRLPNCKLSLFYCCTLESICHLIENKIRYRFAIEKRKREKWDKLINVHFIT